MLIMVLLNGLLRGLLFFLFCCRLSESEKQVFVGYIANDISHRSMERIEIWPDMSFEMHLWDSGLGVMRWKENWTA